MFKDKENRWTRERSFLEVNGGDIVMIGVALFFFALTVGGFYVVLFRPHIPGLSELFSDPPAPVRGPPPDQKLHLVPGEQEILLFNRPAKPAPKPENPPQKP